jgi:hypothetical protein
MVRNLTWTVYAKWLATVILIVGTAVNSLGYYPLGPIILIVGGFVWLAVSIAWREPSLILTNAVMSLTGLAGVLYKLYLG